MCTAMFWKGSDSYFGRNLDIEKSFGEEVVFVPKNFSFDFPISLKSRFAMVGIGIVKNGDIISIDIPNNKLELKISDDEIKKRMESFVPKKKELSGYLKRYATLVSSGAEGAVLNSANII